MGSNWYVSACLGMSTLAMAYGWDKDHKTLVKERAEHEQYVQNFKTAQDLANQKLEATTLALRKEALKNAQDADQKYNDLYDVYHANLLRYQANQSRGSKSGGDQLPTTQGTNGSGKGSQLSISLDDANTCAVNTARLQVSHQWAMEYVHAAEKREKQQDDQPQY